MSDVAVVEPDLVYTKQKIALLRSAQKFTVLTGMSKLISENAFQKREPEQRNGQTDSQNINLDALLTPAEFGRWIGESESWVRRRLGSLPGVIRESRKHIRIHPRTYLEKRLNMGAISHSKRSW